MSKLRLFVAASALLVTTLLPFAANAQGAGVYVDPWGNVRSTGYYDAWGNYVSPGGPYSYYGPRRYYGNRYWHNRMNYRNGDWRDIVNGILYNIPY